MNESGDPQLSAPVVDIIDPELEAMKVEQAEVNASLIEQYNAMKSLIDALQADVEALHAGQSSFETDVTTLKTRVQGVEDSVVTLEERMSTRFDDFDAAIERIRADILAAEEARNAASPSIEPMAAEQPNPERDIEAEIALTVDNWRQAWQMGNLDAYMGLYEPEASIVRISLLNSGRGRKLELDPMSLAQRMQVLMQKYDRMQVVVLGFRVIEEDGAYVATFQQEFSAWANPRDLRPIYTDSGVKTLVFREHDGMWKIAQESWVPVQRS